MDEDEAQSALNLSSEQIVPLTSDHSHRR